MKVKDSTFKNNTAQGGGGAIYWTTTLLTLTNCNDEGNKAKYGDFIGSPPIGISYLAPAGGSNSSRLLATSSELNDVLANSASG